jgi:hypothetical protein
MLPLAEAQLPDAAAFDDISRMPPLCHARRDIFSFVTLFAIAAAGQTLTPPFSIRRRRPLLSPG